MPVDMNMVAVRVKALTAVKGDEAFDPSMVPVADALSRWLASADQSGFAAVSQPAPAPAPSDSAPRRKLGRKPMRPDMRDRLPRLSAVAPSLPPAPAQCTEYVDAVGSWILGANDRVGDCTCVAPANVILALTTLAQRPVRLNDTEILAFYSLVSGYNPADPSSDQGAMVEDVLAAWHARGIAGDRLDGFASLDVTDHDRVRQAIAHLGPVDLGVNLPEGWEQASVWDVSTAGSDIAGGHCITAVGYTDAGPLIVSWGQVFTLTWAGWDAYVEEAHVLLSRDALTAAGKDADGVDWAGLQQDMQRIAA